MFKLLFICSRNRRRSLTAEALFAGSSVYQARSAGTQPAARIVVTEGHVRWADFIFCMEKNHTAKLRLKFPAALVERQLITLHIRDDYEYLQPELVDELLATLAPHLPVPLEPA